ncbi:hypothetical protein D8M36_04150 [Dermabacter sp. HSID17554]|nr:hypothetical protein D8M36_04150 [Dermabacter sp. HSID17554]
MSIAPRDCSRSPAAFTPATPRAPSAPAPARATPPRTLPIPPRTPESLLAPPSASAMAERAPLASPRMRTDRIAVFPAMTFCLSSFVRLVH